MVCNPLVSVIVPCYNKERFASRTLSSLRSQTYANFEVVIVDDCSTDSSWQIIQDFVSQDARFFAERSNVNRGADYCRNRGFALSKGEYLIFLDADDWLADDCIARRVAEMQNDCARDFDLIVFPSISSKQGRLYNFMALRKGSDALLGFLRQDSPWQTMMPIWRRDAFARLGGFNESFPRLQDVEIFSRALLSGIRYKASERQTYDCYYCDEDSRLMDFSRMAQKSTVAMLMFLDEMKDRVQTKAQSAALAETELVAIRTVGDIFQIGGIAIELRNELYQRVLSRSSVSWWTRIYAFCYKLRINKLRGFNFLFVRFYRLFRY